MQNVAPLEINGRKILFFRFLTGKKQFMELLRIPLDLTHVPIEGYFFRPGKRFTEKCRVEVWIKQYFSGGKSKILFWYPLCLNFFTPPIFIWSAVAEA